MSDEPIPRPWRVNESIGGWRSCVSDANGNPVASCWGGGPTEQQEKAEAAAALIVDAVNEHDRLRADCERMREALEHIAMYDIEADYAASLAERALAACGAGETPKGKGVGR